MSAVTVDKFECTRAALVEFDASKVAREECWAAARSDFEADRAYAGDKAAARKVQCAFYEDTKAFNALENCMRIHVEDIRRMTQKGG